MVTSHPLLPRSLHILIECPNPVIVRRESRQSVYSARLHDTKCLSVVQSLPAERACTAITPVSAKHSLLTLNTHQLVSPPQPSSSQAASSQTNSSQTSRQTSSQTASSQPNVATLQQASMQPTTGYTTMASAPLTALYTSVCLLKTAILQKFLHSPPLLKATCCLMKEHSIPSSHKNWQMSFIYSQLAMRQFLCLHLEHKFPHLIPSQ